MTSGSSVVGWAAVASSVPSASSTSAAFVHVDDPTSTQRTAGTSAGREGDVEVGEQVRLVLDADREAHEVARHLEVGALDGGGASSERGLDERLDAAERLGEGEDARRAAGADRGVLAARSSTDTMPPKRRIWRAATSWFRCSGSPG